MTTQFRFCIAMGFFAVIGQTSSTMCYNITRNSYLQRCCSGYNNDHRTCTCGDGWKKGSCEEPLLCYMASEASEDPPDKSMKNVIENSENRWKSLIRECQPECLRQIDNYTISIIGNIEGTKYHLISNELKCNTTTTMNHQIIPKIYILSGVVTLIIILLVMVIVIAYTVCKKRKTKRMMKNESTESSTYNDVSLRPMSNTYDDIQLPSTPHYDDVIVLPNHVYDDVLLVPHYDDVNVQPIGVYDDVGVGSYRVYDEVNVEPILDPWSRSNPRMVTIKNHFTYDEEKLVNPRG